MKLSTRRRRPLRLCALAALSVGLLFPAGAAQATATGTVVAWGCGGGFDVGDFGQCSVPGGLSGVTAIAAGRYHSLALTGDGTVVAWGCGAGTNVGQCSVPSGLSGVTAIAAGFVHSLALEGDGTVVAWGCGNGENWGQCSVPSGLAGVTAIGAGLYHSLALKGDGTVVAWGCGGGVDYGQCSVPSGLAGVTAIAAGSNYSLALKGDGTVVAWGCNGFDGEPCTVPSGLAGVTAVAAGFFHSLALKGDGTVVAWSCYLDFGQCSVPSSLAGVTAIAAGFVHSLALKGDGSVFAWGCGSGDFGQCSVPSGLAGVTAIAAGQTHSLALVELTNGPPDCSGVTAAPDSISQQLRDQMTPITLSGATDPDGDTLVYHIDGVTQDEYVTGVGDDTFPDAALTSAGADSNQVFVRPEANSHFNGRVYRIAYTVSDGNGGSCSRTAGPSGNTTAKVGVPRKKGTTAIDDGNTMSWDSFTGAHVS